LRVQVILESDRLTPVSDVESEAISGESNNDETNDSGIRVVSLLFHGNAGSGGSGEGDGSRDED
jgi:hypothetical protein